MLSEKIKHFVKPAYVELNNSRAVVRFNCKEDADMFLVRHTMKDVKINVLSAAETGKYFELVQKQRT